MTAIGDLINSSSVRNVTWSNDSFNEIKFNVTPVSSCYTVNLSAVVIYDDSRDLVSRKTAALFSKVKEAVAMPILFIVGFPASVLNLAVFCRQGLRQPSNLSLFVLSCMDLVFVIYVPLKYSDSWRPDVFFKLEEATKKVGPVLAFIVRYRLVGLYGFGWASMFVSAVVATERCLCVVLPLRSQSLLRPGRLAVILGTGVLPILATQCVIFGNYSLVCVQDVVSGETFLQQKKDYYLFDPQAANFLDTIIFGIVIPISAILVVSVVTFITAVTLLKTARFRSESSSAVSLRELSLTRMLILLSIQFIILNLPISMLRVAKTFAPQFNYGGRYSNTYEVAIGTFESLLVVSASTKIFVYVSAGSRFRETVRRLFRCPAKKGLVSGLNASEKAPPSVVSREE